MAVEDWVLPVAAGVSNGSYRPVAVLAGQELAPRSGHPPLDQRDARKQPLWV
jgi:hypothetical protein